MLPRLPRLFRLPWIHRGRRHAALLDAGAHRTARAPLLLTGALLTSGCLGTPGSAVSVYSGPYTANSLPEEIALFRPLSFEDATLVAVAASQVIAQPSDAYRWEVEGNLVQWFGDQDHQELNGLILFRWLRFPWDAFLDTSFAFGNGLSLASEDPKLEEELHPDTGTNLVLYHIAVEFDFRPPSSEHWSWFVRVHHRSGVFGLFDGVDGGSNVLALGLRYSY